MSKFQGFRSFLWPKEYDLRGSLEDLYDEFKSIKNLESLEEHPAWEAVSGLTAVQIQEIEKRLFDICTRPVENEKEIQGLIALRLAMGFFLELPNLAKGDKKQVIENIEKRLKILKESTAEEPVPTGSTG